MVSTAIFNKRLTREETLIEMIKEDLRVCALANVLNMVNLVVADELMAQNAFPGDNIGECVIDLLGVPRETHNSKGEIGYTDEETLSRDSFTDSIMDIIAPFEELMSTGNRSEMEEFINKAAPRILEAYKEVAKDLNEECGHLMAESIISLDSTE